METVSENIRRITLRVPAQLHTALTEVAEEREISLNHLAIEALGKYVVTQRESFPLQELSTLLAPAAETKGISEEDLMRHIKEARSRIWKERYQEMMEAGG